MKNAQIIWDDGYERAAKILRARLEERNALHGGDFTISLQENETMEPDSFRLSRQQEGCKVEASNLLGMIHGCGRFLRGCVFPGEGFSWTPEEITIKPYAPMRGVYFASHFHNYFHMCSVEEMTRYLEDMALWGWKYIKLNFPAIDIEGPDDPDVVLQTKRHKAIYREVHALGMKYSLSLNVNFAYKDFPPEWHAAKHNDPFVRRGDTGNVLCRA